LIKDTELSTPRRALFRGDISALAQKSGYLQVDAEGKPCSKGSAWLYLSSPAGGEQVPEGHLDFNTKRLYEALVANHLVDASLQPCVTSFYPWPSVVEFRRVDSSADDVIIEKSRLYGDGTLREHISPFRGALAINVACYLKTPDGNLIRAAPGVMSYPQSWIERYGSPEDKYLAIWYSYVHGASDLASYPKDGSVFAVLGDILTIEQDKPCQVAVSYTSCGTSCGSRFAVNLSLQAHEMQEWVASSFGMTLARVIGDETFREAIRMRQSITDVQFSDIGLVYNNVQGALLAKDQMPKQLPEGLVGLMDMYTRTHYKPLVERMKEKVHVDADMTRMMGLL
jgi:hypothetical protein